MFGRFNVYRLLNIAIVICVPRAESVTFFMNMSFAARAEPRAANHTSEKRGYFARDIHIIFFTTTLKTICCRP